jgi:hypothetical protein
MKVFDIALKDIRHGFRSAGPGFHVRHSADGNRDVLFMFAISPTRMKSASPRQK